MTPEEFETAIPATKRSKTYALDLAATGIGKYKLICDINPNANCENFYNGSEQGFLYQLF
jgi:hypothetical protein